MPISRYHGNVQYTASPQISITKRHRAPSKEHPLGTDHILDKSGFHGRITDLSCPHHTIKSRTGCSETPEPHPKGFLASCNPICQLWD